MFRSEQGWHDPMIPGRRRSNYALIYMGMISFLLSGCANLGAEKVVQDRINYTAALSDSWKEQMLLNMVKIRYGDAPIFLDVSSVITSYELSGTANLSSNFDFQPEFGSGVGLGVQGFYANRPTISYTPLSGEKFSRSLMHPIPPTAIINLIQSGYPADLVLRVLVQSINGVQSRSMDKLMRPLNKAAFTELAKTLQRIQAAGVLAVKFQRQGTEDNLLLVFSKSDDPNVESDIAAIKRMLGLAPQEREFQIVYGLLQADNKEIAILTRSVLQVLTYLATYIDVPATHVTEKRASPTYIEANSSAPVTPLIRIHSSPTPPADAFFAVQYRNTWYWIDDRDLQSKQIFSFLMFVFTLVDTGARNALPVMTVPVR